MKYGIVGIGPVGGVFAAHLAQAGHPVVVLCRNLHRADLLRRSGFTVDGKVKAKGEKFSTVSDLEDFVASKPDVVLICTKSCDSLAILKNIKALRPASDMQFVSCQNGIDVEEQIVGVFGADRASRMILNLGCTFISKYEIWVEFFFGNLLSHFGPQSSFQERLSLELSDAGLATALSENYKIEAFKKAILNSMLGSVCALTHMTMKEVLDQPELLSMVREIARESIVVARAIGLSIGEDFVETAISYLSKGGHHKPSMAMDVERRRATENDYHLGKLLSLAQDKCLDVPIIQTMYYLLKNLERTVILNNYVATGTKENVI